MQLGINNCIDTLLTSSIEVDSVSADSMYDSAIIHKNLHEQGITPYMPKRNTADKSKTELKRDDFEYNHKTNEFVCPNGKSLIFRCLQRYETGTFKEYRAYAKDCKHCSYRSKCLAPSQTSRKIQVNIFQNIVDKHHQTDGSPEHTHALNMRQIWCEGTFAMQKSQHNLGKLLKRGLRAAKDHCLLSAAAVNMKRMVKCLG